MTASDFPTEFPATGTATGTTASSAPSPTTSRFYEPCLQVLQQNAPNPMSVAAVINAVFQKNHEQDFRPCHGAVRAVLIRMAHEESSPIRMVAGSQPPIFYVENAEPVSPTANLSPSEPSISKGKSKRSKSIFYKPACEILKAAGRSMSVNEVMHAIIEKYPDLQWSQSQGPIRYTLLSAAKLDTPIQQEPGVLPPKFFYREAVSTDRETEVPASAEEIMGNAFAKTQSVLKETLLEKIKALPPLAFEHLANRLVAKMLFGEAEDTPASCDNGIDGYVNIYADPLGLNTVGVQAKHYLAGNVQRPEIQQFIGALHGKNGVFVTCSKFSPKAIDEAKRSTSPKIVLIDGSQLVDYMLRYNVGVRETGISYTLAEVDEEFFEEL